jgi:hypothetical protein
MLARMCLAGKAQGFNAMGEDGEPGCYSITLAENDLPTILDFTDGDSELARSTFGTWLILANQDDVPLILAP